MQKFKTLFAFLLLGIVLVGLVWFQRAPDSISIRVHASTLGSVGSLEINGERFAWEDHQLKRVWSRLEATASTMPPGSLTIRVQADEQIHWRGMRRVLQSVVLMRPDIELTVTESLEPGLAENLGVRLTTDSEPRVEPDDITLPDLVIDLLRDESSGTTAVLLGGRNLGTGVSGRDALAGQLDTLKGADTELIGQVVVTVQPEPGVPWGEVLKTLRTVQGEPGTDGQPNSRLQLIGLRGIYYEDAP